MILSIGKCVPNSCLYSALFLMEVLREERNLYILELGRRFPGGTGILEDTTKMPAFKWSFLEELFFSVEVDKF